MTDTLVAEIEPDKDPAWTEVAAAKTATRDLPVRLAGTNSRFERIHASIDGDGRSERIALNLILARLGFPLAILLKRHRNRYTQALELCDNDEPGRLAEQLAQSVIGHLHRFVCPTSPARRAWYHFDPSRQQS